ncbi:MAG: F0F1 ATP synthase subunit B family protein [Sphingomonas sp.]|uniref:F0F1 ATP synthase subunit B family protein n=1 Tax=Sphingomonas sp. TaxID=28214 RepID=UPI003F80058C
MPQFDPTFFLPQLVWLAIFFAVLYFGIIRLTLPRVGRVMQAREDQVSGDLGTAQTAKAEADGMAADYEASIATAQDAARGRVNEARSSAAAAIEAKLKASNAAIADRAAKAEAELEAARAKALGEIESVAAGAAADIVERLTGNRPADAVAAGATRAALA